MTSTTDISRQLSSVVLRGQVLSREAQLAAYECDGLGFQRYRPDLVVIPVDADELITVVKKLGSLSVPWTIRGAGTSLSGGPVAAQGGVIVHLSKLNAIERIDVKEQVAVVESGVVLAHIDAAAQEHGLYYPPDASSGNVCTIGGNVACNSGGAHCFRYGVTSDYVLGVEMILPDGTVERFGGAAGGRGARQHDWKRLLIGSEGTLGVFTRFWLRLIPPPERVWTFQAIFDNIDTMGTAIAELSRHPAFPSAIEIMDPRTIDLVENSPMAVGLPRGSWVMLAEIDGPTDLVDGRVSAITNLLNTCGATQVATAIEKKERLALWQARKVQGGLLGQVSPDFIVQDAVIPKAAIAEILTETYRDADENGIAMTSVLHAGDGNLHPNFMFDSRDKKQLHAVEALSGRLMRRVSESGGTLSGEHGIGNDKAGYMRKHCGPVGYAMQRAIPALTNGDHQLNPLKILPERRYGSAVIPKTSVDAPDRLFEPFVDPIDMVACVPAGLSLNEINASLSEHGLRFPLICDGSTTLAEHLRVAEYAPASARFGGFVDNILGMNWQLPSGAVARIGERVVKSATGYDLKRFLLHTTGRFGTATHFVLRLRPIGGAQLSVAFSGKAASLDALRDSLTSSCWIHWMDSLSLRISEENAEELFVHADFLPGEDALFLSYLKQIANACKASIQTQQAFMPRELPTLSAKMLPGETARFARDCVKKFGGQAQALLVNGVVLIHPQQVIDTETLRMWSADLAKSGGHVHAADFNPDDPLDSQWADLLDTYWKKIT